MDEQEAAENAELTGEDTLFHAWNRASNTSNEAFQTRNDPFDTWNMTFHGSDTPPYAWNEASDGWRLQKDVMRV